LRSYYKNQTDVQLLMVRHKKNVFEIDGERFCYQQCFSDRPGFNIVVGEEQRPVVHAYCAMGLEHQHEQQRVVLARCTSYVAAAVWVDACMTLFPKTLTRYILGDCATACSLLWSTGCVETQLGDKLLTKEWKTFGYERWMEAATRAYQAGTRWDLFDWIGCSANLHTFEASTWEPTTSDEPRVVFTYATWPSHVRPTEILLHPAEARPWRGHLHLSGVDHILNEAWMRWRNPTLIVNFVDLRGDYLAEPYVEAIRSSQQRGTYRSMNLAWSNMHDRLQAVDTFRTIAKFLEADETQHVIFHCRDGKDKSAFGILALLQVHYQMPYEDAMDALRARVACDGNNPLVHLKKIPKLWWDWLESQM
jgi:hypothetical protein